MNSTLPTRPRSGWRKLWIALLLAFVCLPLLGALAVANYFRLSSDTKALRRSVISSMAGPCDTRIAVRVGWLTTALVRMGSRLIELPPEPRAALAALRGVEVGVYELQTAPRRADYSAVLAAADRTMAQRGWERMVGVLEENQCVAVYIPRQNFSTKQTRCCVVVLSERDLVMVSARANVEPLLDLVCKEMANDNATPLSKIFKPRGNPS